MLRVLWLQTFQSAVKTKLRELGSYVGKLYKYIILSGINLLTHRSNLSLSLLSTVQFLSC